MEVPIRRRIMIHLKNYSEEFKEDYIEKSDGNKASFYISQKGIAKAVDGSLSQVSRVLREMAKDGLVRVEKKYLKHNHSRKRKTYELTSKGLKEARKVHEELKEKNITIIKENSRKEICLGKLQDFITCSHPILYFIKNNDDGILDIKQDDGKSDFSFINREKELDRLNEKLENVRENGCSMIFLIGEAGIGKTALVNQFKKQAERIGFRFLEGKAYHEISDPYLPFKNAFQDLNDLEINFQIPPNSETEEKTSRDGNSSDVERKSIFFDLNNKIKKLANDKPLVIFIDDLQWADKATIYLLNYMIDNLSDSPVLFLTAYRSQIIPADHPIKDIRYRLSRQHDYNEIILEPLGRKETRQLIFSGLNLTKVPEDFVDLIYETTEGNPLFIKEFIDLLREEGKLPTETPDYPEKIEEMEMPQVIEDVYKRKLDLHLSEKGREIATIGSVIGKSINFELLRQCSDMGKFELCNTIEELLERGVWNEKKGKDDCFTFNHGLMNKITYQSTSETKKRELHKTVAEHIEDLYEKNLEVYHSDLGYHYEKANERDRAVEHYVKAGDRAKELYALDEALDMYRKALNLVKENDETNLLRKLGAVHKMMCEYGKAIEIFEEIIGNTDDLDLKSDLLADVGEIYLKKGQYEKALKKVERGLSIRKRDDASRCMLLNVKGKVHFKKGHYKKAKKAFRKEWQIAENLESKKEIAQALHNVSSIEKNERKNKKAIDLLKRAIDIRDEIDDKMGLSESLNQLGVILQNMGEFDKAKKRFKRALDLSEKTENKAEKMKTLNNLGKLYKNKGFLRKCFINKPNFTLTELTKKKKIASFEKTNRGDFVTPNIYYEKAFKYFNETLKLRKQIADEKEIRSTFDNLGSVCTGKDDLDDALKYYKKSLEISEKSGSEKDKALSLYKIGLVHEKRKEMDKALNHLKRSLDLSKKLDDEQLKVKINCGMADICLGLGKIESYMEHINEVVKITNGLEGQSEGRLPKDIHDIESNPKLGRKIL